MNIKNGQPLIQLPNGTTLKVFADFACLLTLAGTNWTVLDTVGLEVGDDASLRDLRRKISHKLPDVILVALSLRDQRRWSDPNFEATKLLKTQLSMVQNVFMRQTGNKCRAPIVWVATQLDEAR